MGLLLLSLADRTGLPDSFFPEGGIPVIDHEEAGRAPEIGRSPPAGGLSIVVVLQVPLHQLLSIGPTVGIIQENVSFLCLEQHSRIRHFLLVKGILSFLWKTSLHDLFSVFLRTGSFLEAVKLPVPDRLMLRGF
jgi:hypothetical protein